MAESSPDIRRRLSPERRRADLLQRAASAFAADGFGLTTREIAARCGVTQALLYRYFDSKDALIEAVLRDRFLIDRAGPDPDLLAGDAPLDQRLSEFYVGFVSGSQPENLRLFLRAALDGLSLPRRYASKLDARMLRPVTAALRREAGRPDLPAGPIPSAEREVAMALHSLAVFTLIRRDVYGIGLPLPVEDLLGLQMRVAVPGAVAEIGRASAF
jgi:AcrR family transcriptional regulator